MQASMINVDEELYYETNYFNVLFPHLVWRCINDKLRIKITSWFHHMKGELIKWTITGKSTNSRRVRRQRKPPPPSCNVKGHQHPLDIHSKELIPWLDQLNSTAVSGHSEEAAAQAGAIYITFELEFLHSKMYLEGNIQSV